MSAFVYCDSFCASFHACIVLWIVCEHVRWLGTEFFFSPEPIGKAPPGVREVMLRLWNW